MASDRSPPSHSVPYMPPDGLTNMLKVREEYNKKRTGEERGDRGEEEEDVLNIIIYFLCS